MNKKSFLKSLKSASQGDYLLSYTPLAISSKAFAVCSAKKETLRPQNNSSFCIYIWQVYLRGGSDFDCQFPNGHIRGNEVNSSYTTGIPGCSVHHCGSFCLKILFSLLGLTSGVHLPRTIST